MRSTFKGPRKSRWRVLEARCYPTIRFAVGLWPDITVAVRMDQLNQSALDYYLVPHFF
jgi:hypothetical protein